MKNKLLKNIDPIAWQKIKGHATLQGLTISEFLKLLIELYEITKKERKQ